MTVGQQRWWVKMATRRQSTAEHQALQQSRELQCLPPSPDKVRRECLTAEWNGDVDYVHMYIMCVQYSNMVMGELCNIILM